MAALEVERLTKDYGEVLANDDVTFAVEEGEVFGYLGPNGAGKTTTIRTLMGFQSPTSGGGTVLGHDVTDETDLIAAKRRIGYLPANPAFDEGVTGREVLDLHASIKGDERRADLLETFDPPIDRKVRDYSTGNVQKLGLVQAFMHDPDLVVMDEPTAGLDPLMQRAFNDFVEAEKERGLTVFLSSHVLSEVRRVCDRVGIIRQGRLVTTERIEDLLQRTGKFVRVRVAGDVSASAFDIDGVHDVSCSTTDGGRADDRTEADDPDDGNPDDSTAGPSAAAPSDTADTDPPRVAGPVTECTFTFTGDVNELIAVLGGRRVLDLDVEEAPLEEVFMRFYGGNDA
ncbi:ABC transporter ATP-binding protein [Halosimplex litoreum]|uniref:ABC transporter ATP-binding protein n=1 Tax=Halosimplex litoreum TaxID=1198301 RepID=A0A7U3WAF3_9EURY|nr:ABC transporter ATP-binding protein [Halosimplex litoreum]QPV64598.1 ABC transporter ATP-binding protein [Halosimplex litoreum]